MTTLDEVLAAEQAASDAEAAVPVDTEAEDYASLKATAESLRETATNLRALYEHQATSNDFDLGDQDGEEFYIVTSGDVYTDDQGTRRSGDDVDYTIFGSLKGGDGQGNLEQVTLSNLSDPRLANKTFKTHEGERYIWTSGNTYTFGGSKDYSYGSGYEVSITEATRSEFKRWDGYLPYDIVKPITNSCEVDTSNYDTDFTGLPNDTSKNTKSDYKVSAPAPGFFFRKPEFLPENNAVSKNIGHQYDYQLGDTYAINLSVNTNDVKLVDNEHNFESVGVSENHSHVGLQADFNAHGMDVELGIKAADIAFNVKGVDLDSTHALVGLQYSNKLVDINYEQAKVSFQLIDRPQFKVSDENIQTLTSKRVETVSGKGIVFQVDENQDLNDAPGKILGSGSGDTAIDMVPFLAWGRSVFGSSSQAKIELIDVLDRTDVNNDREDVKPEAASSGYSRLDIDSDAIGLVSYLDKSVPAVTEVAGQRGTYSAAFWTNTDSKRAVSKRLAGAGKSIAEFVLNSRMRLAELSVRGFDQKARSKKDTFTQTHDLVGGRYSTTYYEDDKKFVGKLWFTKTADDTNDLTANTAGLSLEKDDKNTAQLKLNTEKSSAVLEAKKDKVTEFARIALANDVDADVKPAVTANSVVVESQKSASQYVKQTLDAANKKYRLEVNKDKTELELNDSNFTATVEKNTKLDIKKDLATLTAKKTEIKADTSFKVDSKKMTVTSQNITLDNMKFTGTSAKIPKNMVTLGKGANVVKISATGVELKGSILKIQGKLATITGNLIKLG